MNKICEKIKKKLLPDSPGVYRFLDARRHILYIGKASSLRSRVKSYCSGDIVATRGPVIVEMLARAKNVSFEKTDSVLEALILEAVLIKKHQPKYNTKEKSDKSFNYVVITDEDFPRVLIRRERELLRGDTPKYKIKHIFGPFPQGSALREALKIVRKIFPFRDVCKIAQVKPCFNAQIGLCPGVCVGKISKKEYSAIVRNTRLFFEGKKKTLIKKLEHEMKEAARKKEFEKAGSIKKTIFSLNHINDVSLMCRDRVLGEAFMRVEAYDASHFAGDVLVGAMAVVEDGEIAKSEYRKFHIKSFEGVNDTRALAETLERRLVHHEWRLPRLIVVDGGKAQVNIAEKTLKKAGLAISVIGVVKDERHRPKRFIGSRVFARCYENDILLANSEAHRFAISFHKKLMRSKSFQK